MKKFQTTLHPSCIELFFGYPIEVPFFPGRTGCHLLIPLLALSINGKKHSCDVNQRWGTLGMLWNGSWE
jgi:hypothetical protein